MIGDMKQPFRIRSKLELNEDRITIALDVVVPLESGIFENIGLSPAIACQVAEHLADSNLCGIKSHGLMRTLQYAEQFESGYMRPDARPET